MKRFFKGLIYFLLAVYMLACVALYFAQEKIIFHPDPIAKTTSLRGGEEFYVEVAKGIEIHCASLRDKNPKGVILYLHGNRGNNRHCYQQARNLSGLGYNVVMPDYRGFGKSDGYIKTQKQFYRDMEKLYEHLLTTYKPDQIKIVGYSIGTGVASYLASKYQPKELILLAPYVSILDMKNRKMPIIPSLIVKYQFRNDNHISKSTCPVTLIHGTSDEVIPFESSKILQKIDPTRIQLMKLDGVSHRRTIFNDAVRKAISS